MLGPGIPTGRQVQRCFVALSYYSRFVTTSLHLGFFLGLDHDNVCQCSRGGAYTLACIIL